MLKTNPCRSTGLRPARAFDTLATCHEALSDDQRKVDAGGLAYSQYDRMILGGATPKGGGPTIDRVDQTGSPCLFDQREVALVKNLGASGEVKTSGAIHELARYEMRCPGMGTSAHPSSSNYVWAMAAGDTDHHDAEAGVMEDL